MSESSSTRTPTGGPGGRSSRPGNAGERPGNSPSVPPEGPITPLPGAPASKPGPKPGAKVRPGDRIFKNLTTGAGIFVVALIGLIGLFLLVQAIPALKADKVSFLFSRAWATGDPNN